MSRAYLVIVILHLALIFQGCASLEYLDGSSEEEIRKSNMTKDEIWNEMEKLKAENANLQEQIDASREENQRIVGETKNEIAKVRNQNELLNEQIKKVKEENQRISDEAQALEKKLAALQLEHEATASESYELKKDVRELKIKVLSGDGDLNSAKKMATMLRNMDYKVESVHYAPRSNFLRDTVYFAPEFQEEAKRLAFSLGHDTISKPLTWSSAFDLIVVAGKNP